MSDPASFAAAVLALAEAAFKLGRLIATCRNEQAEILALNNEANDLAFVLDRVNKAYPPELKPPLLNILARAEQKIQQLHAIIADLNRSGGVRLAALRRVKWTVARGKVCKLLAALREIRSHLSTLIAVETA